jgi:shikimate kinase
MTQQLQPSDRHIMLVGMMGAGKSTVGALLAERLGRSFVDVDDLVEATAGRPVPEIFATDGEDAFRALERAALADACASPAPLVIATGGGAMADADNRRVASRCATVVWLQAEPGALAARVGGSDGDGAASRPLLASADPVATLERLSLLRADAYAAVADTVVPTDDRSVEQVADAVLAALATLAGKQT